MCLRNVWILKSLRPVLPQQIALYFVAFRCRFWMCMYIRAMCLYRDIEKHRCNLWNEINHWKCCQFIHCRCPVPPRAATRYGHTCACWEEWGGMRRAVGNADSAWGILMAVLVTSCAFGFVYVFKRARAHAWENTRFYSSHFRGPFGKELRRIYDQSFTSWRVCNLCCRVFKMQNRNSNSLIRYCK